MHIGLRSVEVKRGLLYLNNRRVQLRGASMHEDMIGRGAALTGADLDTMVRELKELGANITRSHYVLSEALLRRLDRAGIMVWNQAPVWQRDHGANLLRLPAGAQAGGRPGGAHGEGRAQPPVGDHALGGQRADLQGRHASPARKLLPARRPDEGARARSDAADLGRHQGPPRLRRAVRLQPFEHDRHQPVLRLVPVGRGLRPARAVPPGDARPLSRARAGDDRVRRRGAPRHGRQARPTSRAATASRSST